MQKLPTKFCPECNEEKYLFEFTNRKTNGDGKHTKCKYCERALKPLTLREKLSKVIPANRAFITRKKVNRD